MYCLKLGILTISFAQNFHYKIYQLYTLIVDCFQKSIFIDVDLKTTLFQDLTEESTFLRLICS